MTPPSAAAQVAQPRPTVPRRALAPSRPRRVSGPARPAPATRPARRSGGTATQHDGGLARSLPAAIGRLAPDRLLDRLIAGKLWIAVVAFALIGIVTLQLTLLKLNTSIGHALQREGALQRANAALSIENSELAAGERVESSAAQLGMQIVPPGALRFLTARPGGDAVHASHALATPVPTQTTGAATEGSTTSASNGAAGTTAPSASGGETQTAGGSGSAQTAGTGAGATGTATSAAGSSEAATGAPSSTSTGSTPSTGGPSSASSGGAGTEPPASGAATSAGGTQSAPTG